jgi:hypothetical protein
LSAIYRWQERGGQFLLGAGGWWLGHDVYYHLAIVILKLVASRRILSSAIVSNDRYDFRAFSVSAKNNDDLYFATIHQYSR